MSPAAAPGAPPPGSPARAGRVRAWLDERLGLAELEKAFLGGRMPGGASFWHALGSVAAGLVLLETLTGLLLAAYYAPAVNTAWASVAYIQDELTLGWFVRGLHSFGSSALIVVAGLHLLQVLLFGAYRRPRELNWMLGLALFGLCMLFALTGYLLPWDQKGYWAKLVEATITGSAPVVGPALQQLIQGGSAFGNITLTHAYAAHALLLPRCCSRSRPAHLSRPPSRPTPKWTLSPEAAAAHAVPRWPDQTARNAAVGTLAS